jgi:hypothetical protein
MYSLKFVVYSLQFVGGEANIMQNIYKTGATSNHKLKLQTVYSESTTMP